MLHGDSAVPDEKVLEVSCSLPEREKQGHRLSPEGSGGSTAWPEPRPQAGPQSPEGSTCVIRSHRFSTVVRLSRKQNQDHRTEPGGQGRPRWVARLNLCQIRLQEVHRAKQTISQVLGLDKASGWQESEYHLKDDGHVQLYVSVKLLCGERQQSKRMPRREEVFTLLHSEGSSRLMREQGLHRGAGREKARMCGRVWKTGKSLAPGARESGWAHPHPAW